MDVKCGVMKIPISLKKYIQSSVNSWEYCAHNELFNQPFIQFCLTELTPECLKFATSEEGVNGFLFTLDILL